MSGYVRGHRGPIHFLVIGPLPDSGGYLVRIKIDDNDQHAMTMSEGSAGKLVRFLLDIRKAQVTSRTGGES